MKKAFGPVSKAKDAKSRCQVQIKLPPGGGGGGGGGIAELYYRVAKGLRAVHLQGCSSCLSKHASEHKESFS